MTKIVEIHVIMIYENRCVIRNMKTSKKKRLFLIVTCVLVIGGLIAFNWFNRSSKIERVLKTESYAYLPKAAQNYKKEDDENTG